VECVDGEVNEEIRFGKNPKDNRPLANTFDPVYIGPWQFRLLLVE
jgi:hypothetical protein